MNSSFLKYVMMPALSAGILTSCGERAPVSSDTAIEHASPDSTLTVKAIMHEAFDRSFPTDTAWYDFSVERCAISVFVDKRGHDWRARILTPEGQLVKTIYESGLKSGINTFSFNTAALEPGDYVWLLTREIYADTVQQGSFSVVPE